MGKFNVKIHKMYNNKNNEPSLCNMKNAEGSVLAESVSNWTLIFDTKISNQVYWVTARNQQNQRFSNKFIIKLGETKAEYRQLKHEYESHITFSSQGFGLQAFGILDLPKRLRGLLMEWSGDSLCIIKNRAKLMKKFKCVVS